MAGRTAPAPVSLKDGSIFHDTDYIRGAEDRSMAQHINDGLPADSYGRVSYVIEDVAPFRAEMAVLEGIRSGHSVYVILLDRQGRRWPMFVSDLVDLLRTVNMDRGLLEERTYEVCKKGTAYGIRLAK